MDDRADVVTSFARACDFVPLRSTSTDRTRLSEEAPMTSIELLTVDFFPGMSVLLEFNSSDL